MAKKKSHPSPSRDSVQAHIEALALAVPRLNQVIGAAQYDRGTGFVDPKTNLNHADMPAKLANDLTKAVEEMRVLTDNVIRAQQELINHLEERQGRTITRLPPEERLEQVKTALESLRKELGKEPSQRQIAERAGLSQTRVQNLLKEMGDV